MFISLFFCLFSCAALHSMENLTVTIKTLVNDDYALPVNLDTTVWAIKNSLTNYCGIPPVQQGLRVAVPIPYTLGFLNTFSDNLLDEVTVREIKNNYGTLTLHLYLTLPHQSITRVTQQANTLTPTEE